MICKVVSLNDVPHNQLGITGAFFGTEVYFTYSIIAVNLHQSDLHFFISGYRG